MLRDLHDKRKSYDQDELVESNLPENPFKLFNSWFQAAEDHPRIEEANAMNLCTLGIDGFPKSRVVLLKEISENGFVFYTNYASEKGKSIDQHNKISLNFFWSALEKQIIIKATAAKISTQRSEAYYRTRPRGSQLGAWVSNQSDPIENREAIELRKQRLENQFEHQEIPLPDFWGGYECKPHSIEFWQGRQNRLHDRILYTYNNSIWTIQRLQP
ncbi:MAG: pyridoxamine 5'-phosphate oxidase [Nonlabens sp.]